MTECVTRDAQRRVFGVVQGLLEGDKDSSPSVQNDRVFRLTMTGLEPLAARPIGASAKKQATFAGIGFLLSQFRERKSRATFAGIAFLLTQFRERKSRATFAEIACCVDRMPVQRRRPAPGLSAALAEPLAARPIGASAKKRAKVVQLLLKLLVVLIACPCKGADRRPARSGPPPRRRLANGQTAASAKKRAKVVHLLLKLLVVLIACPCKGADRRPAFRPPSRSHWPQGQLARAQKNAQKSTTFAGILGVLIACPCKGADRRPAFRPPSRSHWPQGQLARAQKNAQKSTTFAGIAFLLAQFRERESLQLSLELLFC